MNSVWIEPAGPEQHPLTRLEAGAAEQAAHALPRTVGNLAARADDLAAGLLQHRDLHRKT